VRVPKKLNHGELNFFFTMHRLSSLKEDHWIVMLTWGQY